MNINDIESLRNSLNQLHQWPSVYLFKFVILNEPKKIEQLRAIFTDPGKHVVKPSKNGKYISFSITEVMTSAESVIEKYQQVGEIEGVISL